VITRGDHIAPWRSVYTARLLAGRVRFVLSNSGQSRVVNPRVPVRHWCANPPTRRLGGRRRPRPGCRRRPATGDAADSARRRPAGDVADWRAAAQERRRAGGRLDAVDRRAGRGAPAPPELGSARTRVATRGQLRTCLTGPARGRRGATVDQRWSGTQWGHERDADEDAGSGSTPGRRRWHALRLSAQRHLANLCCARWPA